MTGAFLFLPEVIRSCIEPMKPGVYMLGDVMDGKFVVGYVGRSDICLQKRLLTHNHLYEFSYFFFEYTQTSEEAYIKEAELWHNCVDYKIPIANKIHPDSPGNAHLQCPYCQMARSIQNSLDISWLKAS